MKKNLLIFLWALAPVALLAYHFGPGQAGIAREEARSSIRAALEFEADEQWQQAIDAYNDAHHYRAENPLTHLHEDEAHEETDKLVLPLLADGLED